MLSHDAPNRSPTFNTDWKRSVRMTLFAGIFVPSRSAIFRLSLCHMLVLLCVLALCDQLRLSRERGAKLGQDFHEKIYLCQTLKPYERCTQARLQLDAPVTIGQRIVIQNL